jgi:hypothetical protein
MTRAIERTLRRVWDADIDLGNVPGSEAAPSLVTAGCSGSARDRGSLAGSLPPKPKYELSSTRWNGVGERSRVSLFHMRENIVGA